MDSSKLKRHLEGIIPLALLSVLLLVALTLMVAATQNSALFGSLFSPLLIINVLGLVLLLALILFNLGRLVSQFRARVLGSRLTLRLLGMFVLLTLIPVSVVFFFSLQALNRGIDSWFDVKIEQAMDDALSLGRNALDALKKDLKQTTQEMAIELEGTSDRIAVPTLNYLLELHKINEITLFAQDGKIIASSSLSGTEAETLVPSRPDEMILSQIRQGLTYANLDPVGKDELVLRIVVPVYSREVGAPLRILQVLQQLPNRYTKLAESVQSAFAEYEKLLYLRGPLKFSFVLTLSMVALSTVLIVISGAMFAARRLVAPVRNLAEGTAAVAQGNYRMQLPISSQDEFGILVRSFNEMTLKIHQAQSQIKRSQVEAEIQSSYLEAVLTHLSSGVVSFDSRLHLRKYNSAASQILGVDLGPGAKQHLSWLQDERPQLTPFADTIQDMVHKGKNEWQAEVMIDNQNGRRTLILRGSRLPAAAAQHGGYVVVFDDVTTLIQAQRDAAWGEVARRMAHEIKNPLTPIQLSAERIRHKCMAQLATAEQTMLTNSTQTIIDQVESLKSMVNAFSDYARPVQMQHHPIDLNQLVTSTIELYNNEMSGEHAHPNASKGKAHNGMAIEIELEQELPEISADPGRLRQVLHNLLLNAKDALSQTANPLVRIGTRSENTPGGHFVELKVVDNGPGIPQQLMEHLFEPYVTDKEKGTGLGLAIVKKIIEEHNGHLWVENTEQGGASITIQLPVQASDSHERGYRATNNGHNNPALKERKA